MALPFKKPAGSGSKGGFLHGASGKIAGYAFDGGTEGENKNGRYQPISVKLTIEADGAAPKSQFLRAGFIYGDTVISADGLTLEGSDDYLLDPTTEWGMFVQSLVEGEGNRMPEEALGNLRNFAGIVGARVEFKRVTNAAETERRGQREVRGRDGKVRTYDRDNLLVANVIAMPTTSKAGAKTAAAKKATATVDYAAADAAFRTILGNADGGTVQRNALGGAILHYAMKNSLPTEAREALRKVLVSEEYQADAVRRGVIIVAGEGKTAEIAAGEARAAA